MSSIWQSIKEAVVEKEDSKKGDDKEKTPPPVMSSPPSHTTGSTAPVIGTIDPEIRATIEKAYLRQGSPLALFVNGLKALETVIADPPIRVKAALASLSAQGTTPAVIVADIQRALDVVSGKKKEADEASAAALQAGVGTREQEVERIAGEIKSTQEQIAQAQQNISQLQQQQAATSREIEVERQRIGAISAGFNATADAIIHDLANQMGLVKQHTTMKE